MKSMSKTSFIGDQEVGGTVVCNFKKRFWAKPFNYLSINSSLLSILAKPGRPGWPGQQENDEKTISHKTRGPEDGQPKHSIRHHLGGKQGKPPITHLSPAGEGDKQVEE